MGEGRAARFVGMYWHVQRQRLGFECWRGSGSLCGTLVPN
ncbi:hypothetical protein chiPu_0030329, partial [Chiloscyllium punctatum]|nr:hypothetical protein [Chiloscyllium punctatum]